MINNDTPVDRNFDDVADRFEQRIYGKLKGDIRQQVIWRDLEHCIPDILTANTPLRILDLGAGLGQFSIALAAYGHAVTYNDISTVMTQKAQQFAIEKGVKEKITWLNTPYQALVEKNTAPYDIILCHALLEWLAEPLALFPILNSLLTEKGRISLCFYNPKGLVYRNLMRGNFHYLKRENTAQSNAQGFTPNNPCEADLVINGLKEQNFTVKTVSGIRVFSDYAREKRGGLNSPEAIMAMELEYSKEEPFKWLGRYLHIMAERTSADS